MQWPTGLGLGPRAKVRVRVKVMGNVGVSHQGWSYAQYCVILCTVSFSRFACVLCTHLNSEVRQTSILINVSSCTIGRVEYSRRIIRCFRFTVECFIIASVSVDSSMGVTWIYLNTFYFLHQGGIVVGIRLLASGQPYIKMVDFHARRHGCPPPLLRLVPPYENSADGITYFKSTCSNFV